jgi:hypothetical protein
VVEGRRDVRLDARIGVSKATKAFGGRIVPP